VAVTGKPRAGEGDYRTILAGTSQNVLGVVVAAGATFGAQVLISRTLGQAGFGVVTVLTQAAFVTSFATRAGMDMAVLRNVAIDAGSNRRQFIRTPVVLAVVIAAAVSLAAALLAVVMSGAIRSLLSIDPELGSYAVPAAALGIPFLALTNVWLAATRGLKIMKYQLYVFFAGQPLMWMVLMALGWTVARTAWMAVLAYSLSWMGAALAAFFSWRRESRAWGVAPLEEGALGRLVRYAGPRAPAALFSQLLFWTDLFVLTNFVTDDAVGVYSAALRAGQVVVLFLTSVNLMFSPFVADLHNRGEHERLDKLFKALTRWTVASTLPLFLIIAVVPDAILEIFGPDFAGGRAALLILLAGQLVNIATGSAGFVLIMAGRTGWDLGVYGGSLILDVVLALWLCPRYGMEGAAISNAVTFAASNSVRLFLVRRFVHIQPYDRHYGRLVGPAVLSIAAMWLLDKVVEGGWAIELVVIGGLGVVVYGIAYALVGLTPEERKGLSGVVAGVRGRRAPAG
jgi:O-antigen/teichoic acid export membrane protein